MLEGQAVLPNSSINYCEINMDKENRQYLELNLYSRIDLSSQKALESREKAVDVKSYSKMLRENVLWSQNAENIIKFICDYNNGDFLPDKCDANEPIRELFNKDDFSQQIRWLSQADGQLMLRRLKPIKYLAQIENKRRGVYWIRDKWQRKGELITRRPDPLFLTYITFWFNIQILKKRLQEYIRKSLVDFTAISNADFGHAAMGNDIYSKNLLFGEDEMGKFQQFVGNDPEEYGIPGVYWINFFGKVYVDWLGRDKFKNLKCYYKEELDSGGYLVQCAENPLYYETEEGAIAKEIINHLGPEAFFDIGQPKDKRPTPFNK
jgi:hypothetical protein